MLAAIVPAAGFSTRMGGQTPKLLLPWGQHTVIEQVVTTLAAAGLSEIVVVTGHRRAEIEAVLAKHAARCVFNPAYERGEMLSSLQAGLAALPASCSAALLALADQPQLTAAVVRQIRAACEADHGQTVIAPSYQMRRGHPICLPRWLWPEVLALAEGESLRALLSRRADAIRYVVVDTPSILSDLDTPEQYAQELNSLPKQG